MEDTCPVRLTKYPHVLFSTNTISNVLKSAIVVAETFTLENTKS